MNNNKLKVIISGITIIGLIIIGFIGFIANKATIVHPDAIITVFNDTTHKKTQAYAIGSTQVYIDQTYRMEMPLWETFINVTGFANNTDFEEIKEPFRNENLSMLSSNSKNNVNPFIVKLKVKNLSEEPLKINYKNFKLRDLDNNIYKPNDAWQQILNKAGLFAGTDNDKKLNMDEEEVLWLVYGTPTETNNSDNFQQEYVQINYGSDSDLFATKVEIPFNYTIGYPLNDYNDKLSESIDTTVIVMLIYMGLCGTIYFKTKD